jgi:hypothetical protein
MIDMTAYWLPKDGTPAREWEDGAAYSPRTGRFAVADGASTGVGSREWAYSLVASFVRDDALAERAVAEPHGFLPWVAAVRAGFDPHSPEFPPTQVPDWVRAAGDREGAHATFLGGVIDDHRVRVVAVGDCCLFHLEPGAGTPRAFPIADAAGFGNQPLLISSRSDRDRALVAGIRHYRAAIQPGDVVLVASDALAAWLATNLDIADVWQAIARIGRDGFADLCRDLRATQRMRNDDVTLLRARVPAGERS